MKLNRVWLPVLAIIITIAGAVSPVQASGLCRSDFLPEKPLTVSIPSNELSGREAPSLTSSTPLGSAGEQVNLFWPPYEDCGPNCDQSCQENLCGIGYGRCNPFSLCACECW